MDFISNQKEQFEEMLAAIGVKTIDELFSAIPPQLKLSAPAHDDGMAESEVLSHMESLAAKNSFPNLESYLGGGAYDHYVPALVQAICSKSEFLTAYTPYQAEASQGMLQIIFEFQSAICALTGMDVANASVYDGASACAEALLMALRALPDRKKVLISEALHPNYRSVVQNYLSHSAIIKGGIPFLADGTFDFNTFKKECDENTAAVLISYPNFFGVIDDIAKIAERAHSVGALVIVSANPLMYGLYKSAKELGADIAVGDCQPLGVKLQFGGPYAGYMACREGLLRQLPGRIAGESLDADGKRAFVLTLQAREQHIRREKATSNICTNQALVALASLITILWYGRDGLCQLALTNYQRAHYLKDQLRRLPHLHVNDVNEFNEFIVRFDKPLNEILKKFREHNIVAGIDLGRFFPQMKNCLLVNVTETKSKAMLDRFVQVLS